MNSVRPHLRIALDSSLNNKGSKYHISNHVGLEIEQCQTLMKSLGWTYQFVNYNNQIGHIMSNGTATGMLGDVQQGIVDIACGRFRMTPDRANVLKFTYPTQLEVNQVYLIADPKKSEDIGFLFRPFSTYVWLLLFVTIVVVSLVFFTLRVVEFSHSPQTLYECVIDSFAQLVSSTFNVEIRVSRKSSFIAFHFFSAIWLLSWFHIFIDFYTSELSGMLVVSDKKQMPFYDFYGFIDCLRKGTYRLLTTSADRIPECPQDIATTTCAALFSEVLSKFPPQIGDLNVLNDPEIMESVCPAAYIVRPTFPFLSELNDAIIGMLPAFSTIDNHYTPSYPQLSLFEKPQKTAFTLNQLSSIFVLHFSASLLASIILVLEIVYAKIDAARNR